MKYEKFLGHYDKLELSWQRAEALRGEPDPLGVAADAMLYMEMVSEFERIHGDKAFTHLLDIDGPLVNLFAILENYYNATEEDTIARPFGDFVLEALNEIEQALDNGDYVLCDKCQSIVLVEDTVTTHKGFWDDKVLCFDCFDEIRNENKNN